jgi:hypothetical protein
LDSTSISLFPVVGNRHREKQKLKDILLPL